MRQGNVPRASKEGTLAAHSAEWVHTELGKGTVLSCGRYTR